MGKNIFLAGIVLSGYNAVMQPSPLPQAGTQADEVFETLRAEILSCRLPPGAKIRINEIALRLGVSPGAVREALSRLSAEGMTVAEAQKGYAVAPVSIDELVDLTATRIAVEQLCHRAAIARGDVEWESGIVAAHHRLRRLPEREPADPSRLNEAWSVAHAQFHLALAAGCGSRALLRIRDGLYAQTERYRRLSVPLRRGGRDVDAEHAVMVAAALARDADRVCRLIADHLQRTTDILLTSPELRRA